MNLRSSVVQGYCNLPGIFIYLAKFHCLCLLQCQFWKKYLPCWAAGCLCLVATCRCFLQPTSSVRRWYQPFTSFSALFRCRRPNDVQPRNSCILKNKTRHNMKKMSCNNLLNSWYCTEIRVTLFGTWVCKCLSSIVPLQSVLNQHCLSLATIFLVYLFSGWERNISKFPLQ